MNINNHHHRYRYFRTFLTDLIVVLAVVVSTVFLSGTPAVTRLERNLPGSIHVVPALMTSAIQIPETESPALAAGQTVQSGTALKHAAEVEKPFPQAAKKTAAVVMTADIAPIAPVEKKNTVSLPPFHDIIMDVAGRYEIDPFLIQAIIFTESGFNATVKSKKGAGGLMQLMPMTAKALGVRDVYDPGENIEGGVRYFRQLLDRFDENVHLALAAYNAGPRHVINHEGVPPFKETQRYVKKVLESHEKFKMEAAGIAEWSPLGMS